MTGTCQCPPPAILFPVLVHAFIAAFVVYVNQHINSDFNLPSGIVSPLSLPHASAINQASDPIPIYRGRIDARLPQPNGLLPLLGWPLPHQYSHNSHSLSFTPNPGSCPSASGTSNLLSPGFYVLGESGEGQQDPKVCVAKWNAETGAAEG